MRFERAWQLAAEASIEEYVAEGELEDREQLLYELLLIELNYRRQRGDDFEWSEYQHRFNEDQACLAAVAERLEKYTAGTMDGAGSEDFLEDERLPLQIRYVGNYEILHEIGRGGMGVVFKAQQTQLNRPVALKMLLSSSLATSSAIQRFHNEARTAAKLHHPKIVAIHEIGEFEGHPWYTMDYVPGPSLADEVARGPLDAPRAARLVRQIAETIQFAHEAGVLHRDLKPANVLLGHDNDPKVADFGLAKLHREQGGEAALNLTETGQIVGTPSYLAPEQASGKLGDVGVRSDVWALGGILYACLTGNPPFSAATALDTLLHVMRREPIEPRAANPSVPRDLENICLKCLSKEPQYRYPTAAALAKDLERFENGRPVLARPLSKPAWLWRWSKRNPVIASLSLLSLFLLVAGTTVSAMFASKSEEKTNEVEIAKDRLQSALTLEQEAREFALDANMQAVIALKKERKALSEANAAIREMHWNIYKARLYPIRAAWEKRDYGQLQQLLNESRPTADSADLRGWEWYFFHHAAEQASRRLVSRAGADRWIELAANHDLSLLALRRKGGSVDIVDSTTGKQVFTIPSTKQRAIAWHPGQNLLAVPTGLNQIEVWDVACGKMAWSNQTPGDETSMVNRGIEWDTKGHQLAMGGFGRVDLFSLDGTHQRTLHSVPSWTRHVVWHQDGKLLGCGGASWFGMIDVNTDKLLWQQTASHVNVIDAAWDPNGTQLAVAWGWPAYHVKLYDQQGKERIVQRSDSRINSIDWRPDGKTLLSGTNSQLVEHWHIDTGRQTDQALVHDCPIYRVQQDHQGKRLITLDSRGCVRTTNWPQAEESKLHLWANSKNSSDRELQDEEAWQLTWKPGPSKWLAIRSSRQVWIVDVERKNVVHQLQSRMPLVDMAWHPHEEKLLTFASTGKVTIWNTTDGKPIRHLHARSRHVNRSAGWSPDGEYFFAGSGQYWNPGDRGTIDIWDSSTYQLHAYHGGNTPRVLVSWDPCQDRLALLAGRDGSRLKIIDPKSGDMLAASPPFYEDWQDMMTFNPLGNIIAIGFSTGKLALVSALDGSVLHWQQLPGHQFTSLQWSPDGERMAAITSSRNLLFLSGDNGEPLIQFDSLGKVRSCGWHSSGDEFAVVCADGLLQIWNAPNWSESRLARSDDVDLTQIVEP